MPEAVDDVIVVGAGAIGMATALELAQRGRRVHILERGRPGGESSWAGAGIIYPAFPRHATNPFERLRAASFDLWPGFADRMGEDVGFRRCGAVVIEPTEADLERVVAEHRRAGTRIETRDLREIEPNLDAHGQAWRWLPEVCQVRNPRLVRALTRLLTEQGVRISDGVAVRSIVHRAGRVAGVELENGKRFLADTVVITAGAWSAGLLPQMRLPIAPVRGQIVLFRPKDRLLKSIIDADKHYLVPRDDGRILAGSTEEHVGFVKATTPEAFDELRRFAIQTVPKLADAPVETSWAGLRPGTPTGTPYLFEDRDRRGLWIAAGHFRLGLQLAPGTAQLLADWITGRESFARPEDFDLAADRTDYRRSFTA